jgi:hypothetical protein
MTSTADTLVLEQLWQAIQPLLPIPPRWWPASSRLLVSAWIGGGW